MAAPAARTGVRRLRREIALNDYGPALAKEQGRETEWFVRNLKLPHMAT